MWLVLLDCIGKQFPLTDFIMKMWKSTLGFTQKKKSDKIAF